MPYTQLMTTGRAITVARVSFPATLLFVLAMQLVWIAGAQTGAPTKPQGFQRTDIEVNGIRLHYLDWGTDGKQPFIMLHGISRIAHQFDHIALVFNRDYHVFAIDMRGHGDSGWSPEGAYLVEDY